MPRVQSLFIIFLAAVLSLLSEPAQGEKTRGAGALFLSKPVQADNPRIALVIGNGKYGSNTHPDQPFGPLENPPNDARLISGSLRDVGFEVITHLNLDKESMIRAVTDFGQRLKEGGQETVGVFYYAGHGIQVDGQNYMIPVGSNIRSENDIRVKAVKASSVLKEVASAENKMNLFILDACRNKPSTDSKHLPTQGFEKMDAPEGSMVAFATGSGELSQDGPPGGNSPYSKAVAKYISEPGLTVEEVFKKARVRVLAKTNKRQMPREDSSLTSEFYFVPTEIAQVPDKTPKGSKSTERISGTVRVWPLGKEGRFASSNEVEIFFDHDEGIEGPLTVSPDLKGEWQADFAIKANSSTHSQLKVFARWLPEDGPRFDPEREAEIIIFPHPESVDINLYQFKRLSNRFSYFGELAFRKLKKEFPCAKKGEKGPTAVSKCWNKSSNRELLKSAQAQATKALSFYEQAGKFDSKRKNESLLQMAHIENSVSRSCRAFEKLKSIDFDEWKTKPKKLQRVIVYSSDALYNCLRSNSHGGGHLREIRKALRFLIPHFSEESPLTHKKSRERVIGNWLEIFRLVAAQSSDDRMVAKGIWSNGIISQWKEFTKVVDKHFVSITFPEIVDSPPIIEAQLFRIRNKLGY
jgi:hypothetical protein